MRLTAPRPTTRYAVVYAHPTKGTVILCECDTEEEAATYIVPVRHGRFRIVPLTTVKAAVR
jgi:hypothetical protein